MEIPRDIVGYTEYMLGRKLFNYEKELLTTMYDAYKEGRLLNTSDIMTTVGRGSARINWAAIFALCIFRHDDWIKDLDEKKEV